MPFEPRADSNLFESRAIRLCDAIGLEPL